MGIYLRFRLPGAWGDVASRMDGHGGDWCLHPMGLWKPRRGAEYGRRRIVVGAGGRTLRGLGVAGRVPLRGTGQLPQGAGLVLGWESVLMALPGLVGLRAPVPGKPVPGVGICDVLAHRDGSVRMAGHRREASAQVWGAFLAVAAQRIRPHTVRAWATRACGFGHFHRVDIGARMAFRERGGRSLPRGGWGASGHRRMVIPVARDGPHRGRHGALHGHRGDPDRGREREEGSRARDSIWLGRRTHIHMAHGSVGGSRTAHGMMDNGPRPAT